MSFRRLLGLLVFVPSVLVACFSGEVFTTGVEPDTECSPEGSEASAADGCNTCTCTDGRWACTERACEPEGCPEPREPQGDAVCPAVTVVAKNPSSGECCEYADPCSAPAGWTQYSTANECEAAPETCEPGDTKAVDCNTCNCTSDGQWLCTRAACTCSDGDTMDDGCNTCTCVDGSWACTAVACPEDKACGGFAGNTCTETEYCAYEEGQHCGQADASAFCKPRPDACDQVYDPVCGCDGETYGNACTAAVAGTGVMHAGECEASSGQ